MKFASILYPNSRLPEHLLSYVLTRMESSNKCGLVSCNRTRKKTCSRSLAPDSYFSFSFAFGTEHWNPAGVLLSYIAARPSFCEQRLTRGMGHETAGGGIHDTAEMTSWLKRGRIPAAGGHHLPGEGHIPGIRSTPPHFIPRSGPRDRT